MTDIVVLRYTENTAYETIVNAFDKLKEALPPQTIVLALPYSIDILTECSLEQLNECKAMIEMAI